MQILTWMLIALYGGLPIPVAAPFWADHSTKNTSRKQCPALQAPPFITTTVNRVNARVRATPQAEREVSTPQHSPVTVSPASPHAAVSFDLRVGRLKPQVEMLLREHFAIQHIVWNAPEGLLWPSDYQLQAADVTAMVESLLQPYNLQMRVYANHTAVIHQLTHGTEL